ncbi:MAG: hypothetical protein ABEJ82_04935 [Haloplanus sp.]
MTGDDLVAAVEESLAQSTREAFDRRVREQAERVRADLRSGRLDTGEFAVGMELETYAVDESGRLAAVPADVFDRADCGKELGLHNLELNSAATPFDADGLTRQAADVERSAERAAAALDEAGLSLALDAMWTIPPAEGTDAYLGAVTDRDGVVVADNMRHVPRYVALDNEILARGGGTVSLSLPGVTRDLPTILVESLATSIQPHLQVPSADAFPRYFDTALRTLGPALSLTANSPFLPADWYDDDPGVVETTHHELRVDVFEQAINAGAPRDEGMVRFPDDVADAVEVVDHVVADETYAPVPADDGDDETGTYRETIPAYDHKRGVHWRWVRGVVGGQPVGTASDGASLRIEYRPLPTQPSVADAVAVQSLVVGVLRGLVEADHPLPDLPWTAARDSFYAAVADGPEADLAWVTADGERTDDPERIYEEVFAYARRGLESAGLSEAAAVDALAPVERRVREDGPRSPSAWKIARVREAVDAGETLPDAVASMQRAYLDRAGTGTVFADW